MIKEIFYGLLFIIIYHFLTSCANPISPTGGPKDTIPPTLVGTIPINKSLNFKDKSISLVFDEYDVPVRKTIDVFLLDPEDCHGDANAMASFKRPVGLSQWVADQV